MEENKNIEEDKPTIGNEPSDSNRETNQDDDSVQPQPVLEKQIPLMLEEAETKILKQETENMEVHHHGHVHEKKKWKEYLFQFLMLFLAITLGFFVENQREHYIEGVRAKEYAHTLLQDIIKDTLELERMVTFYKEDIATIDTLLELDRALKTGSVASGALYYYGIPALSAFRMGFNDATLQQLKNSGNLRYFRNQKLKENISAYDNAIRTFALRQDLELTYVPEIHTYSKLFDHVVHDSLFKNRNNPLFVESFVKENPPLLINNPIVIKQFLGFCSTRRRNWNGRINRNIIPVLVLARELITMLKKEYRFK